MENFRDPALYRPNVGLMLLNRADLIFAGRRIDNPDGWQMPQGGIDAGEEPRTAALRELGEETGLTPHHVEIIAESPDWIYYDLPPDLQQSIWGGRWLGQRQKWFALRLTGRDSDIDIATAHPEFDAWLWLTPEEAIERIIPFKRSVYAQVFRAFDGLLRKPAA